MSKNARDRRPYIKPVTRLELSEKNIKFRWIAIAVLLSIAVVSIGYGFSLALQTEPGWQAVDSISNEVNCGKDFVLMYDFGAGDVSNPTAQYKKLEILYTDLTESAYRLFRPEAEGTDNLHHVNTHVNETVTVAPELYSALEQIAASDSRYAYMAPVTALYAPVFLSSTDAEAALYDPMKNAELAAQAEEAARYCADPAMIYLELLEDQQVRLNVAEEYLAYAGENGIGTFLDFGWMTNAFIADYMAEKLAEQGFVYGYLSSHDGFTRNLDVRGTEYTLGLFDRQGNDVRMPANFHYCGPMSIVSLRDYPLSDQDRWNYYAYEDGSITTVFLDPATGRSGSAVDTLMAYNEELGCAEIALKLAPFFTADTLDAEKLSSGTLDAIWFEGNTLFHTQENADVLILTESGGAGYSVSHVK